MDHLRALQVFSTVARTGSFVRASILLSVSSATVSKHVAWLEQSLGAQLLKRNSKQVTLTLAGYRALEGAKDMLERFEALQTEVGDSVSMPRGEVRIGAPPSFCAFHLMGLLTEFSGIYPDIKLTVVYDNGRSDLVSEALDLSIRIAPSLDDASYVARSLMRVPQVVVASPAYFRTRSRPTTVAELSRHNCFVHTVKSSNSVWRFAGDPPIEVRVQGSIRCNLGDAVKQATLHGHGISLHPTYMVSAELQSGELEVVLPNCIPEELDISVVFSTRRNMPARVRHLLEFLKEWSDKPPRWADHL